MAQIPLRLNQNEVYQLDNFYFAGPDLQPVVTRFCDLSNIDFLFLWGHQATGKTHLSLAIIEQLQAKTSKQVRYLPLAELVATVSHEVLASVDDLDLLCIDDLDAIAGIEAWEEALFHCFNRLQHTGCKLLIASASNPAMTAIKLPDLRSRLATGLVYQLNTLNDDQKQQMLMLQATSRGLKMSEDVANYLLRHHSRDVMTLMTLLTQLDNASMAEKRRLTIPFARQVLTNE